MPAALAEIVSEPLKRNEAVQTLRGYSLIDADEEYLTVQPDAGAGDVVDPDSGCMDRRSQQEKSCSDPDLKSLPR